jgi:DNA-directed RNA polymerase specialized sigma24 family protein/ribosome-associated translation inhibitor RaiA
MKIHWVFNDCSETVKAHMESYWEKKTTRLRRLLACYGSDLQDLRLTVYHHPQRSWYEVRAVLHLPTGTLVAEEQDKDPRAVLDRVADTLIYEIKRHKERIRRDQAYRRKTRRRDELSAAGPLLQRDTEIGRREAFFTLLRPMLRSLHDHARRELKVLELEGSLPPGLVTAADLVDEVLNLAWQRFGTRPRRLPLDLWLIDLLHETLGRWAKEPPRLSLEDRARAGEAVPTGDQEWWAQLLGYEEPLTLGDLIPGYEGTEPWEELAAEEQRDRLLSVLGGLPANQRQAFLLNALEGYDLAEIAMLQDRPESEVAADIEAARQALRSRLTEEDLLQEVPRTD